MDHATCDHCGQRFEQTHHSRKYCSAKCRDRQKYEFKKADGRYAADVQRKREQYQPRPKRAKAPAKVCKVDECERVHDARGYCKMHYRKQMRGAGLVKESRPHDDKARDRYHRRRARLRNSQTGEPVLREQIAKRDHWICGICKRKIDSRLRHPDPMSVSLDHVIPLARGGMHDPSNVQIAHLRCNLVKRTDMYEQALMLFG